MSSFQKVEKWTNRWLPTIRGEVTLLVFSNNVYSEISKAVIDNPNLNVANPFYNWLTRNYLHTTLMGVRRQVDQHNDAISLFKLLQDMKNNCSLLTRTNFLGLYENDPIWMEAANDAFDDLAGNGLEVFPVEKLDADIERLNQIDCLYKEYIDRRIAHYDKAGISSRVSARKRVH
jgi:hypothetical protein